MFNIFSLFLTLMMPALTFALPNHCPQEQRNQPFNSQFIRSTQTAVMSLAQARGYFREVQKAKYGIPFNYVVDGCDMRALLISKNLKEKFGISTFRVGLESQSQRLQKRTPHTAEGVVEFERHTAPGFCVLNPATNRVEPYILDPSFFSEPVPLSVWQSSFTNNGRVQAQSFYGNSFSLDPRSNRSRYNRSELQETERLRQVFASEQNRMVRTGEKPYGVGNARGAFSSDFDNQFVE